MAYTVQADSLQQNLHLQPLAHSFGVQFLLCTWVTALTNWLPVDPLLEFRLSPRQASSLQSSVHSFQLLPLTWNSCFSEEQLVFSDPSIAKRHSPRPRLMLKHRRGIFCCIDLGDLQFHGRSLKNALPVRPREFHSQISQFAWRLKETLAVEVF